MLQENTVLCIGELLVDFFCLDRNVSLTEGKTFKKEAGGAPANVAATVAALGGRAAFTGKVGADAFGDFLERTLQELSVDTAMLIRDASSPTTLAFVSLTEEGERDFLFNRGADKHLALADLQKENVLQSKIVHFGSATALLEGELRNTYFEVMKMAKADKLFVSFDPNYRSDLWHGNETEFAEKAKSAVASADFVKVSEEELLLLTGEQDDAAGIKQLHNMGARIVAVTKGKEGSLISNGVDIALVPSPKIEAVDTTGAGDSFVGAVLYHFAAHPQLAQITQDFEMLKEIAAKANAVAAKVCTQIGALSALAAVRKNQDE